MSLFLLAKDYFSSLLDLFYPESCHACETPLLEHESHVCVFCQFSIFTINYNSQKGDVAESRFSEQPVDGVVGLMRYQKKGSSQALINKIKYHGETSLGFYLGQQLGERVKASRDIGKIDFIIPVPLHSAKFKSRGFNQAEVIARGVADVVSCPVLSGFLVKKVNNSTQTKRGRLSRWKNTDMAYGFSLNEDKLVGKNVLLVDDVLTSGATLTSCSKQIELAGAAKKYVAVLAIAGE
mgnify:CR=1 FL=1